MVHEVRVQGLRDLQDAFRASDRVLANSLRATLREVAEPVRVDAEQLAVAGIPRVGVPWSRMRIGVTRDSVYLAPKQRGTRNPLRRRPNLAALLLGRAMVPALEQNEHEILDGFESLLGLAEVAWGRS